MHIFPSFLDIITIGSLCTDGELRLVNGSNQLEGKVEICINSAWGAVCDSSFTKEEATVVCRQLGILTSEGKSTKVRTHTHTDAYVSRSHST